MSWKRLLTAGGWPMWIVRIACSLILLCWIPYAVNSASGHVDDVTRGVIGPLTRFQTWALNQKSPWFAPPLFLLVSVCWVYVLPLVAVAWGAQSVRLSHYRTKSRETQDRIKKYDEQLSRFIETVNHLDLTNPAPRDAKKCLATFLARFEARLLDIVGISNPSEYRMLWIVQTPNKPGQDEPPLPKLYSRNARNLSVNEQKVIRNCLFNGWFCQLDNVKNNPLFAAYVPEHMESIVCARNEQALAVSVVLSIDKTYRFNSESNNVMLITHMMTLKPLLDMDAFLKIMIELDQRDLMEVEVS